MRYLCVSGQIPSHLGWGGYLKTAVELQQRSHQILWASGESIQPIIQRAGLPFHNLDETGWRWPPPPPLPVDPNADSSARQRQMEERSLDQWLGVERVAVATQTLIELGYEWKPDILVSENFVSAAALAAEKLAIPFVVVGWSAPPAKSNSINKSVFELAHQRLDTLLTQFELQGTNWSHNGPPALCSPTLHITYWSPTWFAGVGVGEQTRHVGGKVREQTTFSGILDKLPPPIRAPWVLITLGTTFGNDPNFFITAAHAAQRLGCLPLLALGGQIPENELPKLRARLPRISIVAQFLPFGEILPHVSAIIHHGGVGTTHAAICHAIPQIVVPHAGDQRRQAQGVARTDIGQAIMPRDMTLDGLSQALARLLPDLSPQRENVGMLQAEFAALGGVNEAAKLLENLDI